MNKLDICRTLAANPTHGPDTDQILCAAVDALDAALRTEFATSFAEAVRDLLEADKNATFDEVERELGLACATHVLLHLQDLKVFEPHEMLLRNDCLTWMNAHPMEASEHLHRRGSVLRLLRLLGHFDKLFWREEFNYWIQELPLQPEKFIKISRALMQAVRALGQLGELTSPDLGVLFSCGLRTKHFPAPEVYAALEEICRHEQLDDLNVKENLYNSVLRTALAACSQDVMRQPPIKDVNLMQMAKSLQSWAKNCLRLNGVQPVKLAAKHQPDRPQSEAIFSGLTQDRPDSFIPHCGTSVPPASACLAGTIRCRRYSYKASNRQITAGQQ